MDILSAKLINGRIISALEYEESIHGTTFFCLDHLCGCPLVYVKESEGRTSHFKSSGKGDSKHQPGCAFYQPLDLVDSIAKVKEFQQSGVLEELKEITIRLNMKGIDPDREKTTVEREKGKKDPNELKVKNESLTPQSISSVKGAVKLLTEYEPDILSSILVNVGNGRKVPISQLIVDQEQAHEMLWNDESYTDVGYFIHGKVAKIIKREKVMYVVLEETSVPFTIVIFQKHWKDFSYTEKQLVGKNILVYGHLRKNEFMGKQLTEIIIKSDRYIEVFKRKNQSIDR